MLSETQEPKVLDDRAKNYIKRSYDAGVKTLDITKALHERGYKIHNAAISAVAKDMGCKQRRPRRPKGVANLIGEAGKQRLIEMYSNGVTNIKIAKALNKMGYTTAQAKKIDRVWVFKKAAELGCKMKRNLKREKKPVVENGYAVPMGQIDDWSKDVMEILNSNLSQSLKSEFIKAKLK